MTSPEANPTSDSSGKTGRRGQQPVSALVERARQGEQAAWDAIVERYTSLLWATARSHRLNEADAADAVQVTWLRCVEHLDRIRDPDRLAGWLVVTCRRECMLITRIARRSTPFDATDPLGPLAVAADPSTRDPASIAVAQDEASTVRAAISALPEHQRRLLTALLDAAKVPNTSYAKIAHSLDVPLGSLGPTRQRAFRKLRRDPDLRAVRTSRSGLAP